MEMSCDQIEAKALRLSAIGYLFMGLNGALFYYLASSEAILLDGVYSFISLLMTFIAQRVSRLVQTPFTEKFHFGFAHFEPLLNVVRILLILAIVIFATISAIVAVFKGGRPLNAGTALIYGVLSACGCLFMAWRQRTAARRADSPILTVDSRNWLVDGILSSGVAFAFLGAFLLRGTAYEHWLPFVDPILVIVMVCLMIPIPLKTLGVNLSQVLMSAPDEKVQQEIRERVASVLPPVEGEEIIIRMLPVGRFLYLQVHVLVLPGTEVGVIDQCDSIREQLALKLADVHERLTLDVIFTADRRWTGMGEVDLHENKSITDG